MEDKKVLCSCGREMFRFPEAYLCQMCDASEIATLAQMYVKKVLERCVERERKEQEKLVVHEE
jgi:hypothetical protein